jgi:GH15 family glucan-1,4-alpha-glucosidase
MDDLQRPRALLEWCRTKALPSGVLAEQVHPYTGEPLSVSPLTWSHAAFVSAVQHYARASARIRSGLRDRATRSGEAIA